ncbi:ribonuclease P protein component [Tenacibaculum agarivorans]|uniref:ribonuclease P protein component n=1 Tax=Tenacibaculum agarivorans TaxID=1908389 RepID=UPI00094B873E|nr:ribonuclease P protein component [Tenacibaculum agarivorans]
MKLTLGKQERLKSRKLIEQLYTQGNSVKKFPLRMVYLQTEHDSNYPVQFGVSVPKRKFKRAVDRNRIKRLIRESYRLQKKIVYSSVDKPYVFMISYLAKEEWDYAKIEHSMQKLLQLFIDKVSEHEK